MPAPRILVTRALHQASALAESLRAAGLDPILIPTIDIAPPTTFAPLDAALASLATYHWLIFTSANAVEAFTQRFLSTHPNTVILSEAQRSRRTPTEPDPPQHTEPFTLSLPPGIRIAAIGPATARALQPFGIKPTLIPPQAVAESLADALTPFALQPDGTPTRFLIPRAQFLEETLIRDILPDALTAAGADVTLVPVYRNIIPADSIPALRDLFATPTNYPAAITFTSGSTVNNLIALLQSASLVLPPDILRISIGPITSAVLRDAGLPPHAEAAEATIASLVQKTAEALFHTNS